MLERVRKNAGTKVTVIEFAALQSAEPKMKNLPSGFLLSTLTLPLSEEREEKDETPAHLRLHRRFPSLR